MTGWLTTKEVMDLQNEIISKLDEAPPEVRRYAWYWVSFHVNTEYELEDCNCETSLDDEVIEWLKTQPERYKRKKDIQIRLIESLEKRLEQAKRDLERLH